ncbi:hypothetical protein BCR42DRAFT_324271 [Absidia repens]|uniref:Uncharacterized protein n=1 Tax=Absidia repens TaxID=90262 RepID=A0A1X2IL40_9FUNG|nr:hypothetical protein BCR42DRAFT_324271 [Absidia repens]
MEDFDFDDDVFTASSERKVIPLISDYQAKDETDGWFHDLGDPRQLMLEKLGPVQFKHAIEHDYLHGRYQQALDKALLYIEIITYETGSLLVKGRFYPKCGRYGDAISSLVEYNRQRKRDYSAWGLMADACWTDATNNSKSDNNINNNNTNNTDNSMKLHLSHLAIQRAIMIMTSFSWRMDMPMVEERYHREKVRLDTKRDKIEQQGGSADVFLDWMKTAEEKERSLVGLDDYSWEDIEWIHREWVTHLNDTGACVEEQDDEEKAVKDM